VRELLQSNHLTSVILSEATAGSAVEEPALSLPKGPLPARQTRYSASQSDHRTFRFFVTDSTDKFKRLATGFLGRRVDHVEHVDLGG